MGLVGSPGRPKSRHNKREQRGPAEKLAGGVPGRGDAAGAGASGGGGRSAGPARPAAPAARPPPRPAGTPGPESPPGRPPCPTGRRSFLPGGERPAPARGSPEIALLASAARPPSGRGRAPFPGLFIKLPRPWGAGTGASAAPARRGSSGVNRATDEEALAGTRERCQSEVRVGGPGRNGGAARVSAPSRRSGSARPGGGGADGVGSGARRDSLAPPTPRGRPRAAAQTLLQRVKCPQSPEGTATGGRRPRGQRPGGLGRANFARPVGTSGRVAGAANVALCLGRRLCLRFDVCESSGRPRRRAADSCVL